MMMMIVVVMMMMMMDYSHEKIIMILPFSYDDSDDTLLFHPIYLST